MFDLTLTFDNGPEPDVTPGVLDILARYKIASSFFVIGQKLQEHRKLSERAVAEGHWIGNHTWSHAAALGEMTACQAEEEIRRTQQAIGALSCPERYFRPVGKGGAIGKHLFNTRALNVLSEDKHTCVLWNSIPRDWIEPDDWVQTALEHCRRQPWTLMVLHDLPSGAMRHLPRFLDAVLSEGGHIRQDYPPDCLPVVAGRLIGDISAYVTDIDETDSLSDLR